MWNWNVIYVNFRDSYKPLSVLSRLKIEISQAIVWVIREYCDKNEIQKIWASLEVKIHREYLFPIVDRIDEFDGEETLTFQKQIREELVFVKERIKNFLEKEAKK